ncbi:MAG: MFS transporter, partial [Rickettsiales bacterium]|nr:MFS transporter [Rickettsiales bacterium]
DAEGKIDEKKIKERIGKITLSESSEAVLSNTDGLIKINWVAVYGLFIDDGGTASENVKNVKTWNVFVSHEMRHSAFDAAFKKLGILGRILNFIFGEFIVSFLDFFAFLRVLFRGIVIDGVSVTTEAIIKQKETPNELENLFKEYMSNTFGARLNKEGLEKQIEAAKLVSNLGSVVNLGTGGGKSNMAKLAISKILFNKAAAGTAESVLYTSANDSLMYRDIKEFARYLNIEPIRQELGNAGVPTVKTVDGQQFILTSFLTFDGNVVAFDGEGNEIESFVVEINGIAKTVSVTKENVYKYAKVVGGSVSTFNWDYQDSLNSAYVEAESVSEETSINQGQRSQNWVFVADEAHTLLPNLNQQFIKSSGEVKNKLQLDAQKFALDLVVNNKNGEFFKDKEGELLKEGTHYEIKNGSPEFTEAGKRKIESIYKTIVDDKTANEVKELISKFSQSQFSSFVLYSLEATVYKNGVQYTTEYKKGKIFDFLVDGKRKVRATVTGKSSKADDEYEELEVELEVENEGQGKHKQVLVRKISGTSFNSINENNISKLIGMNHRSFEVVQRDDRSYVNLIGSNGEVSDNTRWIGRQLAMELYLANYSGYNFYDNYSLDSVINSKGSLQHWLQIPNISGCTGFSGTMPTDEYYRVLADKDIKGSFNGPIINIESASVAKPTHIQPLVFNKDAERNKAIVNDALAMRQLLKKEGLNSNGLSVFSNLNDLSEAVTLVKAKLREELVNEPENRGKTSEEIDRLVNENVIVINGAQDDPESISKKIQKINEDADQGKYGKIILGTDIVQVGVDAKISFVFDGAAEQHNKESLWQLSTRAGRSGAAGVARRYYSCESLKVNQHNAEYVAMLKNGFENGEIISSKAQIRLGNGGTESEYNKIFVEFAQAKKDNILSQNGIDLFNKISELKSQEDLNSTINNVKMQLVENNILEQFGEYITLLSNPSSQWQEKVFGHILDEKEILSIGINRLGAGDDISTEAALEEGYIVLERIRRSSYDKVQEGKREFLESSAKIDALIEEEFYRSASKFTLGIGEVSSLSNKIEEKLKYFYGSAEKLVKNVVKDELEVKSTSNSDEIDEELIEKELEAAKIVNDLIKTSQKKSYFKDFCNWILSAFYFLARKGIPIVITALVFGFFGLVKVTGIALFAGALANIGFVWLALILGAVIIVLLLVNTAVKRVDTAVGEKDNVDIATYNATHEGAGKAGSATVNKVLSGLSKGGLISGLLSIALALALPEFAIAMLAAGLILVFVAIVSGAILVAKNWDSFKNNKVVPQTKVQKYGMNFIFGLLAGVVLAAPIVAFGWIGTIAGFVGVCLVVALKCFHSYMTGNALGISTDIKSWLFFCAAIVVSAMFFCLFAVGILAFTVSLAKAIAGVITIAFVIIGIGGKIYDFYKRVHVAKELKKFTELGGTELSTASKIGEWLEFAATGLGILGLGALGLYMTGFFVLASWIIITVSVVSVVIAVMMWLLSHTDLLKDLMSDMGHIVNASSQVFMKMATLSTLVDTKKSTYETMEVVKSVFESLSPGNNTYEIKNGLIYVNGMGFEEALNNIFGDFLAPNSSNESVDNDNDSNEYVEYELVDISNAEARTKLETILAKIKELNTGTEIDTVEKLADIINEAIKLANEASKNSESDNLSSAFAAYCTAINTVFASAVGGNIVGAIEIIAEHISQSSLVGQEQAGGHSSSSEFVGSNAVADVSESSVFMKGFENYANADAVDEASLTQEMKTQIEKIKSSGYSVKVVKYDGSMYYILTRESDGISFPVPVYSNGQVQDVNISQTNAIIVAYVTLANRDGVKEVTGFSASTGFYFRIELESGGSFNFYPIGTDGQIADITMSLNLIDICKKLSDDGYRVSVIKDEAKNDIKVTVSKEITINGNAKTLAYEFYPFNMGTTFNSNFYNSVNGIFDVWEQLINAGFTITAKFDVNNYFYFNVVSGGFDFPIYPTFDATTGEITTDLETVKNLLKSYNSLSDRFGSSNVSLETTTINGKVVVFFEINVDGLPFPYYPFNSAGTFVYKEGDTIEGLDKFFSDVRLLKANGLTVELSKAENESAIIKVSKKVTIKGKTETLTYSFYPFNFDGVYNEYFYNNVVSIFAAWEELINAGYNVKAGVETVENADGSKTYYFRFEILLTNGITVFEYPAFDEDGKLIPINLGNVGTSKTIAGIFADLKAAFGESNVKQILDKGVVYFIITYNGIPLKYYPWNKIGAYTYSDKTIEQLRSVFNLHETFNNNGYEAEFDYDTYGNFIIKVSKNINGAKETLNVYPFDGEGKFKESAYASTVYLFEILEKLAQLGYNVVTEVENDTGKYIVNFDVSKGNKSFKLYPFDADGNIIGVDKCVNAIISIFNVWNAIELYGYDVLADVKLVEGKRILYFAVSYTKDGITVSFDFYPGVDAETGRIINEDKFVHSVSSLMKIFMILKKEGYNYEEKKDNYGNFYLEISKGNMKHSFYPFDKNGNINVDKFVNSVTSIFKIWQTLLDANYTVVLKTTNDENQYLYFEVSKNGYTLPVYPSFDNNGNAIPLNMVTLSKLFSVYEQLSTAFGKDKVSVGVDEFSNMYFTVTAVVNVNGVNKYLTRAFYPFNTNGSFNENFYNNVTSIIAVWKQLESAGYTATLEMTSADEKGNRYIYFNITKNGVTFPLYPTFDAEGNAQINWSDLDKIFKIYESLVRLFDNVEINTYEDTATGKKYMYFRITKDGNSINYYPYNSNGSIVDSVEDLSKIFEVWSRLENEGFVVTVNEDSVALCFVITTTTADGQEISIEYYPFKADGTLNENFYNNVISIFAVWNQLADAGYEVDYKTTTDGNLYSYFEVRTDGLTLEVYLQFDSNGKAIMMSNDDLEKLSQAFYVYKQLCDHFGSDNVKSLKYVDDETGKYILYFEIRKDGKPITYYPFDKDGKYVFDENTLEVLDSLFDVLSRLENAGFKVDISNDAKSNLILEISKEVTINGEAKTLTYEFYPFDSDGNYNGDKFFNSVKSIFSIWTQLLAKGYEVNLKTIEDINVQGVYYFYFEISKGDDGFELPLYPAFADDGNASPISEDMFKNIEKIYEIYTEIIETFGIGNVIILSDTNQKLYFEITSNGKTIKYYPFDKDGNLRVFDKSTTDGLKYILEAYIVLSDNFENVEMSVDGNDVLSFKITENGRTFVFYPYGKNGEEKFDKNETIALFKNFFQTCDDLAAKGYNVNVESDEYGNFTISVKKIIDGKEYKIEFPLTWDNKGNPNFTVAKAQHLFDMAKNLIDSGFKVYYVIDDNILKIEVWDADSRWGNPIRLAPFYPSGDVSGQIAAYVNSDAIKALFSLLDEIHNVGFSVSIVYRDILDRNGNLVEPQKFMFAIKYNGKDRYIDPFSQEGNPDDRHVRSWSGEIVLELGALSAQDNLNQGLHTSAALLGVAVFFMWIVSAIIKFIFGHSSSDDKNKAKKKKKKNEGGKKLAFDPDKFKAVVPVSVDISNADIRAKYEDETHSGLVFFEAAKGKWDSINTNDKVPQQSRIYAGKKIVSYQIDGNKVHHVTYVSTDKEAKKDKFETLNFSEGPRDRAMQSETEAETYSLVTMRNSDGTIASFDMQKTEDRKRFLKHYPHYQIVNIDGWYEPIDVNALLDADDNAVNSLTRPNRTIVLVSYLEDPVSNNIPKITHICFAETYKGGETMTFDVAVKSNDEYNRSYRTVASQHDHDGSYVEGIPTIDSSTANEQVAFKYDDTKLDNHYDEIGLDLDYIALNKDSVDNFYRGGKCPETLYAFKIIDKEDSFFADNLLYQYEFFDFKNGRCQQTSFFNVDNYNRRIVNLIEHDAERGLYKIVYEMTADSDGQKTYESIFATIVQKPNERPTDNPTIAKYDKYISEEVNEVFATDANSNNYDFTISKNVEEFYRNNPEGLLLFEYEPPTVDNNITRTHEIISLASGGYMQESHNWSDSYIINVEAVNGEPGYYNIKYMAYNNTPQEIVVYKAKLLPGPQLQVSIGGEAKYDKTILKLNDGITRDEEGDWKYEFNTLEGRTRFYEENPRGIHIFKYLTPAKAFDDRECAYEVFSSAYGGYQQESFNWDARRIVDIEPTERQDVYEIKYLEEDKATKQFTVPVSIEATLIRNPQLQSIYNIDTVGDGPDQLTVPNDNILAMNDKIVRYSDGRPKYNFKNTEDHKKFYQDNPVGMYLFDVGDGDITHEVFSFVNRDYQQESYIDRGNIIVGITATDAANKKYRIRYFDVMTESIIDRTATLIPNPNQKSTAELLKKIAVTPPESSPKEKKAETEPETEAESIASSQRSNHS